MNKTIVVLAIAAVLGLSCGAFTQRRSFRGGYPVGTGGAGARVNRQAALSEKAGWQGTRKAIPAVADLSYDEWDELCKQDPAYGNVICRCRRVTEAEIVAAIHRVPAARSLDAIKRRTFATAGRCQGGFCSPKIMEILERELGMAPAEVTKRGPGSELVVAEGGEA